MGQGNKTIDKNRREVSDNVIYFEDITSTRSQNPLLPTNFAYFETYKIM